MSGLTPEDAALLRRFEPIACFTHGEQFYPMDAERYLRAAQLCLRRSSGETEVLIERGFLTVDGLMQPFDLPPGSILYLHFVDPLRPHEAREFARIAPRRHFRAGYGRLARVGLLSRLAALLFAVPLRLRGRVPIGSALAAARRYQELDTPSEPCVYHGRVVREHGYVALQYWFFYAFNDWRTSFYGVNDHEADWELVTVYLAEDPAGVLRPQWVAYSAHEFVNDDLRRRWDAPEVTWIGEHPVVYVAAGSHANYFQRGEYMLAAALPFSAGIIGLWRRLRRFWRATLRQGDPFAEDGLLRAFQIPFVEYARGGGLRGGPGQERTWELRPLQATPDTPAPAWVDAYRGLWGLYTGDIAAGEDAPAGPKFRRDGAVRLAWYSPLGWSGLDKVPPPRELPLVLAARTQALLDEQRQLDLAIEAQSEALAGLEIEVAAVRDTPSLQRRAMEINRRIALAAVELDTLKSSRAANELVLEACRKYAEQVARGESGPLRAHLRLPQLPVSTGTIRLSRVAETWSAISIGVLLVGFIALAPFSNLWLPGVLTMLGVFLFVESLFRRQIQNLVRRVSVGLAVVASAVLLYEFFWPIVLTVVLLAGLAIMIENIRELWT